MLPPVFQVSLRGRVESVHVEPPLSAVPEPQERARSVQLLLPELVDEPPDQVRPYSPLFPYQGVPLRRLRS